MAEAKSKLPEGLEEFLSVYAPYMDSVAGSKPSDKYKPDRDTLERQHEMAMEFLNSMRRSGGTPSVRYSSGGGGGSPSMGGGGYIPPPMDSVTKPAVTPATTPEVVAPPTDAYTFKREEPAKKAEKKEDEGGISPLLGIIPGALAGAWLWGKGAGKAASKFAIPWGDAPKGAKAPEGKAPKALLEGDGLLKNFEQQGTGKPMTPEDFLKYYMDKAASDKTPLKDVKDIGNLPSLKEPTPKALEGKAPNQLVGSNVTELMENFTGDALPPNQLAKTPKIMDAEFEEWQLPALKGKTPLLENAVEGELLPKPKELQPNQPTKTPGITDAEFEEWQLPTKIKSKELTGGSKEELKAPEGLPPELKQLEDKGALENILRQLEELKAQFGDTLPMKDQKMVSFGNEKAFQLSPEIKKLLSKEKNMSTIKRMLEDMRNKGKK